MGGIKIYKKGKEILAIVIKSYFDKKGLSFITPEEFPLQIGIHNHKRGFVVKPHIHIPIIELKDITAQEIFYITMGKIRFNIYDKQDKFYSSCILSKGDVILLAFGHAMKFFKNSKAIEFKQGPYRGVEKEKRYFEDKR